MFCENDYLNKILELNSIILICGRKKLMKRKNQWKKSIALGLFLGAATLGSSSIALAQQDILLEDGQVRKEDYDFTEMIGESIQMNITTGSSLSGMITGRDQELQIGLDNSSKKGDLNFSSTVAYGGGYAIVNLANNATWDGDVRLDAELDTAIYYNSEITDSAFTGNINGADARVYMTLSNGDWKGDLGLTTNGENNGISSSANIQLDNDSKWVGNLNFENSGEVNISIYQSEWTGSFEKTLTSDSYAHMGSHFVNLHQGKWNGDYKITNQMEGKTPGYNSISVSDHSEWNGDLVAFNHPEAGGAVQISVSVNDDSRWNGDVEISGSTRVSQQLGWNSHWVGDLHTKDISLDEGYGGTAGEVTIYGNSTWTGSAMTNNEIGVDAYLFDQATWEVTGDSTIRTLYLDETSKVDFIDSPMRASGDYSTLAVLGDLTADEGAQISLRTNFAQNMGDLLDIKGNIIGKVLVGVNNQGNASVDPSKELTIIKTVASDEDTFSLTHEVEVGGFKYMMKQDGTNWVLYSMDRLPATSPSLTSAASGAINTLSAGYLLNYAENESVLKRAGELREGTADRNVWGRVYGGEYSSAATGYVGSYEMDYQGVQIGADKKIDLKNKGDLYLGIMGGYSKGNLDYRNGSGAIDSKTLGIYGTYVAPSDFYSNLILKYGWTNSDFSVRDSAGEGVAGKDLKSDGFSSSLEVGKKIHFDQAAKSGWYVEPQAQITYGAQNGGSVTATNGLTVDLDGYHSLQGRLGMRAGYEVKSGKNPVNVYGKLSYIHEFDGKMDVALNGINIREDLSDSWWNYGIGVTAKVGDRHNIYLEVEKSSGDRFDQKWGITGGYRVNW